MVTEAALKDADPSFRGEPTKFLIVAQADNAHIPDDLLMTWPAALVLTPDRTVGTAIPIQDRIEVFLARQC